MGALLDAVPAGGADHTEHHRDLATAIEAVPAAYQPLDSDLTAIAALTTTAYGRGLLSLANQAALQAEAGASSSGPRLVDLGSVDAIDLLAGPVTLYATAAGECVLAYYVVAWTNPDTADITIYTPTAQTPLVYVADADPSITAGFAVAPGDDVRAAVFGKGTAPWAAATVYAADAYIIEESRLWYTDGGTSGGSQPDFLTNLGGTVGDNGMTWTDETAVPTTGSLHVYALVATAEAP